MRIIYNVEADLKYSIENDCMISRIIITSADMEKKDENIHLTGFNSKVVMFSQYPSVQDFKTAINKTLEEINA